MTDESGIIAHAYDLGLIYIPRKDFIDPETGIHNEPLEERLRNVIQQHDNEMVALRPYSRLDFMKYIIQGNLATLIYNFKNPDNVKKTYLMLENQK